MSTKYCTSCRKLTEFSKEDGNIVCVSCGLVLEENAIVSEVTFAENNDGSSSAVGHFVGNGMRGLLRGVIGYSAEAREMTLQRASRRLKAMADQLNIGQRLAELALRVYTLALQKGFTKGRKASLVSAACLYVVCRREKTPHMLLDFSEIIQTDVFLIGHTFLELCKTLSIQLPIVEPFLYVRRFATQLEFGDKQNAIVHTSLKLIARMKRDWMQTGRRPAGLCAAGLLIAARIHGFKRTQDEVVKVVRICATTLGKRLKEFEHTPAAQMTPAEFEEHYEELNNECDPPAFTQGKEKERKKKQLEQEQAAEQPEDDEVQEATLKEVSTMAEKLKDLDDDVEKRIEKHAKQKMIKKMTKEFLEETIREETTEEKQPTEQAADVIELPQQQQESKAKAFMDQDKDDDDGYDSFGDVDDADIDMYLIKDKDHIKLKEELWNEQYGAFLKEQEEKKKEKEIEAKEPKRRKRKRKDMESENAEQPVSAAEATCNTLKKMSRSMASHIDTAELLKDPFAPPDEEEIILKDGDILPVKNALDDFEIGHRKKRARLEATEAPIDIQSEASTLREMFSWAND